MKPFSPVYFSAVSIFEPITVTEEMAEPFTPSFNAIMFSIK
jgi:hypothetical protein